MVEGAPWVGSVKVSEGNAAKKSTQLMVKTVHQLLQDLLFSKHVENVVK